MTVTDEGSVVRAVARARGEGRTLRIRGGGSSARPPRDGASVLDVSGLGGVVEHRPQDLVVRARAGTRLGELAAVLREHRQRLPLAPHDPEGRGTIGGLFAAGADGLRARLGFRARDVLLGARAVLGNGDVVAVGSGVVKSVAGFDVCKALCGSRGTLAAITEVTLRVEAEPVTTAALCASIDTTGGRDAHDVRYAVAAALRLPLAPGALVLRAAAGRVEVHVLLEGPDAAVDGAAKRLRDAGFGRDDDPFARLTTEFEGPAPAGLQRRSSRADPLAWRPADAAPRTLVDGLRQREVRWTPGERAEPTPARAASPLYERVRRAFDPGGVFQPGRGAGAR